MLKNGRKHLNRWLKSWMYLSPPSGRENRIVLMCMLVLFYENDSWTRQNFSRNLKNLFTRPLELELFPPFRIFIFFLVVLAKTWLKSAAGLCGTTRRWGFQLFTRIIYIVRFWKMLTKVFDSSLQPAYTATFWPLSCSATWFICSTLVNGNTRKTHLVR